MPRYSASVDVDDSDGRADARRGVGVIRLDEGAVMDLEAGNARERAASSSRVIKQGLCVANRWAIQVGS